MEVKYLGFSLDTTLKSISVKDALDKFCLQSGNPSTLKSIERRIYLNNDDDKYYRGLAITVKDQKKFCKLESSGGGFHIEVENLQGNNKLMEFNFFVINKENNIGLYQHYHQSCALMVFGEYLKSFYRSLKESIISSEVEAEKSKSSNPLSQSAERAIRQKYKTKLDFNPLYRQEDIEKILKSFQKIKAFEYEYATLTPEVLDATPLSGYVTRKKEKITFSTSHSSDSLAGAIYGAVKDFSPRRGKVFVEDAEGIDSAIQIFNSPDFFGHEDYDSVAHKLHSLDINNFQNSSYMGELIDICESDDYEHIFQAALA